jgi:hypothetical protein
MLTHHVELPNGRTFVVEVEHDLATVHVDAFDDEDVTVLGHRTCPSGASVRDVVLDLVRDEQPRLTTHRCRLDDAIRGVASLHRHLPHVQSGLFALACTREDTGEIVGWAIVGRPVARRLQRRVAVTQGYWSTVEVTRCATDRTPNACSALYGAACREAWAQGARDVVTYTREDESGASLRAAGFRRATQTDGGAWSRDGRSRADVATGPKVRWWRSNPRPKPVAHLHAAHREHVESVIADAPEGAWPLYADLMSDGELAEVIQLRERR